MNFPESVSTVGVIGAGTMGQGIAQVCAQAGMAVILFDIESVMLEKAVANMDKSLEILENKGRLHQGSRNKILHSVQRTTTLAQVKADLIIEAVVENPDVKKKIFAELEAVNTSTTILTSNTSSLSIEKIGSSLKHKGRFAGLHFFNPAPLMQLVEIVRGTFTDSDTIKILESFCRFVGKQGVHVNDSPGFIVNRVARLYYVEALKLAEEGVADFAAIDRLMRGAGFKMGPFELMDLIGIDTNFAVTQSLYHAFQEAPKFKPSRIQQQKVDSGQLGRKTGKGFYDY